MRDHEEVTPRSNPYLAIRPHVQSGIYRVSCGKELSVCVFRFTSLRMLRLKVEMKGLRGDEYGK